jgi:hypothetical protein
MRSCEQAARLRRAWKSCGHQRCTTHHEGSQYHYLSKSVSPSALFTAGAVLALETSLDHFLSLDLVADERESPHAAILKESSKLLAFVDVGADLAEEVEPQSSISLLMLSEVVLSLALGGLGVLSTAMDRIDLPPSLP